MGGNATGAEATAAVRLGITVEQYRQNRGAGLKWCSTHREWHPLAAFPLDRSRGDGRRAHCLAAERGKRRGHRDPVREKARSAVSVAVKLGKLPKARTLPCTDCGHVWSPGERRHFAGYEPEHQLDVEPVCTTCHADRHKERPYGR